MGHLSPQTGFLSGKQKPKLRSPQKPHTRCGSLSGEPQLSFLAPQGQLPQAKHIWLPLTLYSLEQPQDPQCWLSYKPLYFHEATSTSSPSELLFYPQSGPLQWFHCTLLIESFMSARNLHSCLWYLTNRQYLKQVLVWFWYGEVSLRKVNIHTLTNNSHKNLDRIQVIK